MSNVLGTLTDECQNPAVRSFGFVLYSLLIDLDVRQQELLYRLTQMGLRWNDTKLSNLVNDRIPQNLRAKEVRIMAEALGCNDSQLALMLTAFTCHKLKEAGLIDAL
jgi:succinate dehydrogenase flavin-adding protein (antitoxin of CptAB toxin-antitoxin module)